MAIDVDNATLPVDNALSSPASEGAGEFRALKAKLNNLFLGTGIAATYAGLIDTANKGLNVAIADGSATPLYGSRFKVTRTASQPQDTHALYAEAVLNNGVSTPTKILSALYTFVTTGTGSSVFGVYCANTLLTQQNNAAAFVMVGYYVMFANRSAVGVAAPGGVGANQYNFGAIAIGIDGFGRSSAGEYCGWKTGIKFLPSSMDRDIAGAGYCIDMSALATPAALTADPRTSYYCRAAIRLADMLAIMWDGAELVMTYYDPATTRWTLRYQNNLIFQVDVTTGTIYRNGVAIP